MQASRFHSKPKLFIGCSTEALAVARALKSRLQDQADIEIWNNAFQLGDSTMVALERQVSRSDYAVLITTPDDLVASRETESVAPRDNVVFEAGLFMGHLGRHRAFLLCDERMKLKLPSDWDGLTLAVYNSSITPLDNALAHAAKQIGAAIKSGGHATEVDFLRSYLTFIRPDTRIWDSYAEILSRHYDRLHAEIDRLRAEKDWSRILEIKCRLREYFEYSGKYCEGATFGEAYVDALTALGEEHEAMWAKVKDVGYMLIMSDHHSKGRSAIKSALKATATDSDKKLLFYANRYLGISYERDSVTGSLRKAAEYLGEAQAQLASFAPNTRDHKELDARLRRNHGNLAFANGERKSAIRLYRESLQLFGELEDVEHIGYSHLALAKALVTGQRDEVAECPVHLRKASASFAQLGCIEAHGRVCEQYARYYMVLADRSRSRQKREEYLADAESNGETAKHQFQRIGLERLLGRVDELLDQIRAKRKNDT